MTLNRVMGRMLITGGAGFLGINAAAHFHRAGWAVTLLDNLSRAGSERNLTWARTQLGPPLEFVRADVRDPRALKDAVAGQDAIIHLAAQVAVTTSLVEPLADFEVNAGGTLNLLEAVRTAAPTAIVLHASTNKVYGELKDLRRPIDERQALDFHSPYGCSKGAADQYVRDYARIFGLRTVVMRQSCIYGQHQYGTEDQGWVAHFAHSVLAGRPITIFGDGRQVRDLLDVRDLCNAYEAAIEQIDRCRGDIFNIGGGPANSRSVLEAVNAIAALTRKSPQISFAATRPGDQRYYVSDIARAAGHLHWRPAIGVAQGLRELIGWASSLSEPFSAAA